MCNFNFELDKIIENKLSILNVYKLYNKTPRSTDNYNNIAMALFEININIAIKYNNLAYIEIIENDKCILTLILQEFLGIVNISENVYMNETANGLSMLYESRLLQILQKETPCLLILFILSDIHYHHNNLVLYEKYVTKMIKLSDENIYVDFIVSKMYIEMNKNLEALTVNYFICKILYTY